MNGNAAGIGSRPGDGDALLRAWREQVDQRLLALMATLTAVDGCPPELAEAMRYAVLSPGKRLRPLLLLSAIRALDGPGSAGLDAACAVELVHAYSLVHDDLPAMDDDDLRRGRPTCHRRFGEALAILAGDGLLTMAFELLAEAVPAERVRDAVLVLARAAGPGGMVGGQADDIAKPASRPVDREQVESVHRRKTGRLMEAALRLGALVARASADQSEALGRYGLALGVAFQVADDILAHTGDAAALGRPTGGDRAQGRQTHPLASGLDASRARAGELLGGALGQLAPFGQRADALRVIARMVAVRAGLEG